MYQSRREIEAMRHTNLMFVNGSTNIKMLTIAEHGSTDSHKHATEAKENEQATHW